MKPMFAVLGMVMFNLSAMSVARADGGAGPTLFTMWEMEFANRGAKPVVQPAVQTPQIGVFTSTHSQPGVWLHPVNGDGGDGH